MASGKTTAVQYIQKNAPYVNISYEWDNDIVSKMEGRNLNKDKLEDYLEIQKLWIEKEIRRYQDAIKYNYTIKVVCKYNRTMIVYKPMRRPLMGFHIV